MDTRTYVPKICSNCDATSNLRNCARCGQVGYCSKECQRADWPNHKASCKMLSKVKNCAEKAENGTGSPRDVLSEIVRGIKRSGSEMSYLTFTHAGVVSSTDSEMPPGVPDGFPLIKKATQEFLSHRPEGRQYGEATYRALYDNLVQNEKEWMEFFRHPPNQGHAGDTSMVLEELASILFERKSFEELGGVLDMLAETLHFCKEHCSINKEGYENFCAKTELSMLNLRYEMNGALGCFEENVPVIRDICASELSCNLPPNKQPFNQLWTWALAVLNLSEGENIEASSINDLSDAVVMRILKVEKRIGEILNETDPEVCKKMQSDLGISLEDIEKSKRDVQLKVCATCNKQEPACGVFRACKCKKVIYCGRTCQRQDWKKHSKACAYA
ncbi:hypothetical protein ACHAWF_011939 [Thalassiosira exigua]